MGMETLRRPELDDPGKQTGDVAALGMYSLEMDGLVLADHSRKFAPHLPNGPASSL